MESELRILSFVVFLSCGASSASAQATSLDKLTPAWPASAQHTAEVASNVTLGADLALDTWASWQAPDRRHAFIAEGERVGLVLASAALVKFLVHRTRPCAPACGIDNTHASFFSGHTALAFSTVGGKRLSITIPLSSATGYLRIAANRHYLTDVLAGAGVGLAASRLR